MKKFFDELISNVMGKTAGVNNSTPNDIERIAIDQHGSLGSFYDVYTDNIRGKRNINIKTQHHKLAKETKCLLITGREPEARNLLRFVDIDYQLRLSIVSNMVSANGIAALVDYPQLIDEQTRILYLYHESYIESYEDRVHEFLKSVTVSPYEIRATHIINEIVYGVHLLVILQLSSGCEGDIDILLSNACSSLRNNEHSIKMNTNDETILNQIISIKVYSNIDHLTKIEKFKDIYNIMIELQKNDKIHRPLKYILTPIRWSINPYVAPTFPVLILWEPKDTAFLEHYLIQQSSERKRLMLRINHDLSELLQGRFNSQLRDIQENLSRLRILQDNDIERIRHLIWEIRQGKQHYNTIDSKVSLDPPEEIRRLINSINMHTEELEWKVKFIRKIQNDGFVYYNAADLDIPERSKEEHVKDMLLGNDPHKVMFFSTDTFRKQDEEGWTIVLSQVMEERKNDPQLRLVYADFTYSTYHLKKMEIVKSTKSTLHYGQSHPRPSLNTAKRTDPVAPSLSSPPTNECINILLLGESGVGKSTFINAFANYLRFQTLDEAEKGEPIVIIPVSYVMTINDNFDERIIKFGEIDPNENHNDFGQSVTQQCKSYVFDISKEKKLQIIDTPGFGDTRGDQQDDLNMEEIFSFLNHFTHLNGICLLFKPEVAQLNRYFRSCCTQLFDYFGDNIRDHLIFCFTNARSTFFGPGNTRPLLNTFFESFHVKNILFGRANTFSFDSESFRYLVAIQDSMTFEQSQRGEFEQSWSKSVAESKRFRDYLIDRRPYRKNAEWRSIKDAQFQIKYMIRPLLEVVRNLLRNWLLYNLNSSIQLQTKHAEPSSMICYTCNRQTSETIGQFQILPDYFHHPPNMCSSNERKPTEYRLSYEVVNYPVKESIEDLKNELNTLCRTCAQFSCFIMSNASTVQDDPFLTGIDRMINEEEFICQSQNSTDSNKMLIEKLQQFKTKYEEYLNTIRSNRKEWTLSKIYDSIQSMNTIQMVKTQLDAIREYQQRLVENNQRAVHENEAEQK